MTAKADRQRPEHGGISENRVCRDAGGSGTERRVAALAARRRWWSGHRPQGNTEGRGRTRPGGHDRELHTSMTVSRVRRIEPLDHPGSPLSPSPTGTAESHDVGTPRPIRIVGARLCITQFHVNATIRRRGAVMPYTVAGRNVALIPTDVDAETSTVTIATSNALLTRTARSRRPRAAMALARDVLRGFDRRTELTSQPRALGTAVDLAGRARRSDRRRRGPPLCDPAGFQRESADTADVIEGGRAHSSQVERFLDFDVRIGDHVNTSMAAGCRQRRMRDIAEFSVSRMLAKESVEAR